MALSPLSMWNKYSLQVTYGAPLGFYFKKTALDYFIWKLSSATASEMESG